MPIPVTSTGCFVGSTSAVGSTAYTVTTKIASSTITSRTRSATIELIRVRLLALQRGDRSTTRKASPARAGSTLFPMYPTVVSA